MAPGTKDLQFFVLYDKLWDMNTISFVIPVFNEQKRLSKTFAALSHRELPRTLSLQSIIFVNDGSTDGTVRKINTWAKTLPKSLRLKVGVISYKNNRGKGYAIRQGMLASTADYTLFFDADMSTPLTELKKFAPFMEKKIDMIIGTRKNGKSTVIKAQPFYRRMLGKSFTSLANFLMQTTVTDFTCGFKAFSRQAKDTIFPLTKIDRWTYDAEIIFIGQKYSFPMKEVAVMWSNDDRSKVRIVKDITTTLYELFIIRMHSLGGRYTDQPALSPITR